MGARTLALLAMLIRPASMLLGRLRYAQKFFVVALVLMVPLGFTAQAYVGIQRAQVSSSTREQQGLAYLRSLIMLTGDIVQARRSAVSTGFEYPAALTSDLVRVDDINQRLGLNLASADYTTLGGYIFGTLGRLPRPGDRVTVAGGAFEVLAMEARRVGAVRFVSQKA